MLLERIKEPQDLKRLKLDELPALAAELRQRIIEVVSDTGGHLASSLGAVELILALHYCLDAPQDKIIFDVGHQAYAHKILTGRSREFSGLRQYQGLSGFPNKDESVYDIFTSGHSSTAVSLAVGLACARDYLPGKQDYKVVAVVGDGSLSGGLCFEGLNNAGHVKKDLLVVLNTNELSIAANAGALSTYINKIISLPIYNRFRGSLDNFVKSRLPKESRLIKLANRFEEGLKGLFVPGMFFEELGFRYFGPLDGHNLEVLIPTLKNILNIKGPLLLHLVTKKGKGYKPAEDEPVRFHSAAPFDAATGRPQAKGAIGPKTFTRAFSEKLVELGGRDKRVITVTAAMPEGTGLDKFRDAYPNRFFDVGIAEQHAVCFAAGLAKAGLKPVVAIYSTFLQRAYDQVFEEVALQDLPVTLALDRAGIVGPDGPTHNGVFDIAYLRGLPNLVIMAPAAAEELGAMLEFAIELGKPALLRYPKAASPAQEIPCAKLKLGRAQVLEEGRDFAIFALGSMVAPSLEAARRLRKDGLSGAVINARFAKPLDTDLLKRLADEVKCIITVEEGTLCGGFGSAVSEAIGKPVASIGIPDEFIPFGKREILLGKFGLDALGIAAKVKSLCQR
ncbi:1-deoxy-D-xylulose-5-phosphate synthase [Candidatus Omnitrophota bacterium]